jgi:hypothetical protein
MALVDWEPIIPPAATVSFSSLAIPEERDSIDDDVAQILLEDGAVIDVEWDDDSGVYRVTMFRGEYENQLGQMECSSPSEVVDSVRSLIAQHSRSIPA